MFDDGTGLEGVDPHAWMSLVVEPCQERHGHHFQIFGHLDQEVVARFEHLAIYGLVSP
jgi:hypothetical protein